MIIEKNDIQTETNDDPNAREELFSVGNAGIIFSILREKMYASPVVAVIREIATNARDANREVGKSEVPIEIILPNYYDNELIIKDNGPGISQDRMFNIFIRYGNSTKRESNNFTGAYGIGAKSIYAYADQFTIVTITSELSTSGDLTNIKRKYIAYIDETEAGKMRLISTEETIEPTGTSIIIPVKKDLWKDFDDAVISQTMFWNPRPIIKGRPEYNIPKYPSFGKKFMEGEGWELYYKEYYDQKGSIIILDGIPYSINEYEIVSGYSNEANWCRTLLNQGVALYFNTGDLNVAANRDTLHYDDRTKENIYKKLLSIKNDITNSINDYIGNCSSYLEALYFYKEFLKKFDTCSYAYKSSFKFIPKWNDIEIRQVINTKQSKLQIRKFWRKTADIISSDSVYDLHIDKNSVYILNNLDKSNLRQYADAILNNEVKNVFFFSLVNDVEEGDNISTLLTEGLDDFKSKNDFDLNLIDIKNISDFSPKKPVKKTKSVKVEAFIFDKSYAQYSQKSERYLRSTQIDEKNGKGYYVVVNGHKSKLFFDKDLKHAITNEEIKYLYEFLMNEGELDEEIYVVRHKNLSKLGKNWKPLIEKAELVFKNLIPNNDESYLPTLEHSSCFLLSKKFNAITEPDMVKILITNKNSVLLEYIEESAKTETLLSKMHQLKTISFILKIHSNEDIKLSKLESLAIKAKELYPLCSHLDGWSYYNYGYKNDNYPSKEDFFKFIADYINLVDDAENQKVSYKIIAA
jgi:hypothetical protein